MQCNTVAEKPAGLAAFTVFWKVFCFVIVNNIKEKYIDSFKLGRSSNKVNMYLDKPTA